MQGWLRRINRSHQGVTDVSDVTSAIIALALAQAHLLGIAGCGTVLYPKAQRSSGGFPDWGIVALMPWRSFLRPVSLPSPSTLTTERSISRRARAVTENQETPLVSARVPDEPLTAKRLKKLCSAHRPRDSADTRRVSNRGTQGPTSSGRLLKSIAKSGSLSKSGREKHQSGGCPTGWHRATCPSLAEKDES